MLHDSQNKVGNLSFNFDCNLYGCNLKYLAFSSVSNTKLKYSELFVSHLKVLVSLLTPLLMSPTVLNDHCHECFW